MPATGQITLERTPIQNQIYAKTLLDMGASIRSVAKRCHMGKDTVAVISRQQSYSQTVIDSFKRRLPFKFYQLADDALDLIDRDEIKKAPLGVKMMTIGIAVDKARDMEGANKPIFNVVTVINECKNTRDRLEQQLQGIDRAQLALTSSTVDANGI